MPSIFRSISKFLSPKLGLLLLSVSLGAAFADLAEERTVLLPLVPDGRSPSTTEWRFSTDYPDAGWNQLDFKDDSWMSGKSGFGVGEVGTKIVNDWSVADIWLRKTFDVTTTDYESLILSIQHDDDVEVYLNGTVVFTEAFVENKYFDVYLTEEAKTNLKVGKNVLAAHCHNNVGPGYIDAGLSGTRTMQATTLVPDARALTLGEKWKYTTDFPEGASWYDSAFVDSLWTEGFSGFGSADFASYVGTSWTTKDIWMRKHITVDKDFTGYLVSYLHDDDMDMYVNGKLLLDLPGSIAEFKEQIWAANQTAFIKGDNVIAVHCSNSGGGPQFMDVGIVGLIKPGAVGTRHNRAVHAGVSPTFPRVLYGDHGRTLDFTDIPNTVNGSLEVFRMDGTSVAIMHPDSRKSMAIPARLGTGTFRYLWRSPSGSAQGLLINIP